MKYIGVDYGEKRIGIAVSDADGRMAFPKMTLENDHSTFLTLRDLVAEEGTHAFVIGESKAHDGSDNPIMKAARAFGASLEAEFNLPVYFEPEFYSSQEARMLKAQTGTETRSVDAEAAAVILNSFIARSKNGDPQV